MNKKQLAILEKAWDAQISCALKEQALPELIQAFGTERGVKWSDEARLALEWKARWGDRAA